MKAVTLLCAIVFAISACLNIYNFAQYFGRLHLLPFQYFAQIASILGQCCLVAFFSTLYSRQT